MCDVDSGDYEATRVWSERLVRAARKAHRCAACGIAIAPGESYHRRFYVGDGGAYDEPCCAPCWRIAEAFGEEHRLTPCPSNLLETVAECGGELWARYADEIRDRRNIAPAESVHRT